MAELAAPSHYTPAPALSGPGRQLTGAKLLTLPEFGELAARLDTLLPGAGTGSKCSVPSAPDRRHHNPDKQHDGGEQRDLPAPRDWYDRGNRQPKRNDANPHDRIVTAPDPSVFFDPMRAFSA